MYMCIYMHIYTHRENLDQSAYSCMDMVIMFSLINQNQFYM